MRTWPTWPTLLEAASGRAFRDVPGAGAAGGTTAGLLAIADRFAAFKIRPGIELVMELTSFAERLAESDLVLTGEGRIDEQTAFGKTALGVARRAAEAGVRCVAFGGAWCRRGEAALRELGCVAVPVAERPLDRGGGDGGRCRAPGARRRTRRAAGVARRVVTPRWRSAEFASLPGSTPPPGRHATRWPAAAAPPGPREHPDRGQRQDAPSPDTAGTTRRPGRRPASPRRRPPHLEGQLTLASGVGPARTRLVRCRPARQT